MRRTHDAGAVCQRVGVVGVSVGHADQERVGERGDGPCVGVLHEDDCSAVANVELSSVISDADAEGEAEGSGEPIDGLGEIGVGEFRDDRAAGMERLASIRAASVFICDLVCLLRSGFAYRIFL